MQSTNNLIEHLVLNDEAEESPSNPPNVKAATAKEVYNSESR
jgi:hypothetical protein